MKTISQLSRLSRILLLWAAVLLAQDQTQLVLNAQAPPPVSNAGASYNGVPNTPGVSIYYWVVARYPAGTAIPKQSAQVQRTPGAGNLSATNSVTVSWGSMPSATGYDVLRSDTNQFPAQITCLCAVALNVSGTTFTDTGAGLFQYPPAGVTVATDAQMVQTIDNLTESFPIIRLTLNGQVFRMPPFTGQAVGGAVVITNGIMRAATGNASDCVKVDGSSGTCGGGGGLLNMQVNSVLIGTRDTQNVVAGSNGGLIFSGVDTGTKVNITGSVDRSTVAYVTDSQNGTINSGTAKGTNAYTTCPGLPWTELPRAWSRTGATLTNIAVASNVATATVNANALATGKYVYVWGATVDTDLNGGPYLVTNTSGTTFTFPTVGVADGTYNEAGLSLGQTVSEPVSVFFPTASTGAVTLDMCGLGAKQWLLSTGTQANTGDITAATAFTAVYDPSLNSFAGAFKQIGGGSGGPATPFSFNVYASRGTCNAAAKGQTFWADEAMEKKWVCDGSAWQTVVYDRKLTDPPACASWTTVNGPTCTDVAGSVIISSTNAATRAEAIVQAFPVGDFSKEIILDCSVVPPFSGGAPCSFVTADGTNPATSNTQDISLYNESSTWYARVTNWAGYLNVGGGFGGNVCLVTIGGDQTVNYLTQRWRLSRTGGGNLVVEYAPVRMAGWVQVCSFAPTGVTHMGVKVITNGNTGARRLALHGW